MITPFVEQSTTCLMRGFLFMKVCTKCKIKKSKDQFNPRKVKHMITLMSWCKDCTAIGLRDRRRTKNGVTSMMYSKLRSSSRSRGHEMPKFSNKELKDWLFSNEYFHLFYDNWVASGYRTDVIASIDREDDERGYTFDNMDVTYWAFNKHKNEFQTKYGLKIASNKEVKCTNVNTGDSEIFYSSREAERKTGVSYKAISNCCRGLSNTSGGYYWQFT